MCAWKYALVPSNLYSDSAGRQCSGRAVIELTSDLTPAFHQWQLRSSSPRHPPSRRPPKGRHPREFPVTELSSASLFEHNNNAHPHSPIHTPAAPGHKKYHNQKNTREEAKTEVTQQVQPHDIQWMIRVKQRQHSIFQKHKKTSTYDRREEADNSEKI